MSSGEVSNRQDALGILLFVILIIGLAAVHEPMMDQWERFQKRSTVHAGNIRILHEQKPEQVVTR